MPFVVRRIEPKYVGRGHVPQDNVTSTTVGAELYATSNGTLASTLKQLASLLTVAEDIFGELTAELTNVANRSGDLRQRIDRLEDHLSTIDPKKIPVPESDICTFASRKNHYKASRVPTTGLFVSLTRPKVLQELYDSAAVVAVKSLDSLRRERDGRSSLDMYLCTPVLGKRRRDKSFDIESRVPAVMDDLRRWTSTEALGDVTVPPDCMSRIFQQDNTLDDAVDHKLPSPEEQNQAIALRFPAEIVAVDVSGKGFERMSMRRRSLMAGKNGDNQDTTVKRRSRPRRPRGKRRNTIAGTDRKEIRRAAGETSTVNETEGDITEEILNDVSPAHRSASTDILGKKELPNEKKWHDTLKAWGRSRLKLINSKTDDKIDKLSSNNVTIIDDNSYEMITATQRRKRDKIHERKPSFSSSSGKSIASSIAVSIPVPIRQPVKLRECAAQRRERRKGSNRDDPPHSSSGNWSASSESGRASIGSESTTATNPPRSTTTTSTGTCSLSLNHARRLRGRDTSTSSSVTSEGTLTPDIIQDISTIPFSDEGEGEGETCSVYSCDTEGYYTSFHMDSGLKTLREEEAAPSKPLTKSNEITPDSMSPIVENEYELFGRGSTSTTTSSAGTVCTTLLAPVPPERKSSLTVVAMVHGQNKNGGESPDSGHNTSSSPVESASSPACTARSCSELEYSESSDLEGCDRIERIRSKTAINTARIPSMCVITPPGSDDEQTNNNNNNNHNNNNNIKTQQDINSNEIINCNKNNTGSILMSATVGTSKMQVINGDDKNLYATVQRVEPKSNNSINGQNNINNNSSNNNNIKTSPLSGVLGKLRGVLPLKKLHYGKNLQNEQINCHNDSGDYVTIADVRNNNDKHMPCNTNQVTYANALELHEQQQQQRQQQQQQPYDTEYVSLSELPKKFTDSSLERKRHGARVTLDSEGKVVYSSDSLKRRKGAHTTFNPGPFVKDSSTPSPTASPMFRRAQTQIRSVNTKQNEQPLVNKTTGKVVIRAAGMSPERDNEQLKQSRGAYVNVQNEEDNPVISKPPESSSCQVTPQSPPPYIAPPQPQDWQRYQHNEIHNSNKNNQENIGPNNNQQRINSVSKNFIQRPTFSSPYYTMPNRKTQSDIREQIRCVTPDITRDLNRQNDEKNINRSGQHVTTTIDSRNRFLAPLGLSALGYRFFASSPVNSSSPNNKTVVDGSSNPSISQISMDKSGPRSSSTVAQRLSAMSKNSWTISSSTGSLDYKENKPIHVESTNRNPPPMNILLSPIKSTMSNEELFAAIHKSKRKLNIKNETDRFASNNTINKSYEQIGTRHSWSPESKNTPEVPPAILMPSATARMDFKRLLLQQSSKSNPNRISAAEQLKLSRQQHQQQLQQQHHHQQQQQQCHLRNQQQLHQQPSLARAMSPRSIWRFQTPRSDVLSSTIVEDSAAEERAAKLSPENQIQNNRLRTRRQLDLSGISPIPKQQTIGQNINNDNERYEMNNRLSRVNNVDLNNDNDNRRIRNEKARANFLATGISTISEHGYRTRSESPRNPATCAKSVTRSPSAPTLETAL